MPNVSLNDIRDRILLVGGANTDTSRMIQNPAAAADEDRVSFVASVLKQCNVASGAVFRVLGKIVRKYTLRLI